MLGLDKPSSSQMKFGYPPDSPAVLSQVGLAAPGAGFLSATPLVS